MRDWILILIPLVTEFMIELGNVNLGTKKLEEYHNC